MRCSTQNLHCINYKIRHSPLMKKCLVSKIIKTYVLYSTFKCRVDSCMDWGGNFMRHIYIFQYDKRFLQSYNKSKQIIVNYLYSIMMNTVLKYFFKNFVWCSSGNNLYFSLYWAFIQFNFRIMLSYRISPIYCLSSSINLSSRS